MAIDVTARTVIDRPREDVAAYVIDNRNDPVWIGGISESELLGQEPIDEGSRVRRVASFLGKRIEYVNEVVRLEPGAVLEMRSVKSPFPMRITYAFEDALGGTETSVRVQGEPGGLYRVGAPMMKRAVQRSIDQDVTTLKRTLESGRGR
ncbi:MAG: SRPBCC family protein [Actinomycetota bacterium]